MATTLVGKLALAVGVLAFALRPAANAQPATPAAKTDQYADPLPPNAVARLGTLRLRHSDPVSHLAFQRDGKVVVSFGQDGALCRWDAATGKNLSRVVLSAERPMDPVGRGAAASGANWSMSHQGGSLLRAVLSDDGRVLAASAEGDFIRLLDTTTAQERCRIQRPKEGIGGMFLSSDGARLAIVNRGQLYLWDTVTGKALLPKDQPPKESYRPDSHLGPNLAFAPDNKTIACVEVKFIPVEKPAKPGMRMPSYKAQVQFLDATDGRVLGLDVPAANSLSPNSGAVYSPDGKLLAWSEGGSVHLIDVATGKEQRAFRVPDGEWERLMRFTADGQTLLTRAYADRVLRVWDVATGKQVRKFGTPTGRSQLWTRSGTRGDLSLAVSPGGKIAALSEENTVVLLDLTTGKELPLTGHTAPILRVQYAADGKTLTSWGVDGAFRVWDTQSGKELRSTRVVGVGEYFAVSPDGRTLADTLDETRLSLREAATGKELHEVQMPRNPFGTLAFSPDGKTLAVQGLADKSLELVLYDVASGKSRPRIPVIVNPPADGQIRMPASDVAGLTFSPDGKTLAALISAETLGLWDASTGRERLRIDEPDKRPIQGVVFAPDGRSFVLDLGHGLLSLYESATGQQRRILQAEAKDRESQLYFQSVPFKNFGADTPAMLYSTRPAAGAAFSPDGRLLAHSLADGTILMWNVAAKRELSRLRGHRGYAATLSFSPDGNTLASGGRDTTCLIWDVAHLIRGAKPQAALVDAAACWSDLAGRDAARAYDAMCMLAADPSQAVRFLKDHLPPAAPADADKIAKLIAELDSDEFTVREKANEELDKISDAAAPLLRKALEADPSPEACKRLEKVLARAAGKAPSGEQLRSLRAVELLEMMATPEARQLLQKLAAGAPDARLTREAKAALERISHR
jgi:WD40 repeat protein